jgi:heme-degrading monooxygenase HmoA
MTQLNELPYYAVIFTSLQNENLEGYDEMAKRMEELSLSQNGFLGMDSVRDPGGLGVTVSYWRSLDDIKNWKAQSEHRAAQSSGKKIWYSRYQVRICKVEKHYEFHQEEY